jgi:hypothetical protein
MPLFVSVTQFATSANLTGAKRRSTLTSSTGRLKEQDGLKSHIADRDEDLALDHETNENSGTSPAFEV